MASSEAEVNPPTYKPMAPQSADRQVNFHTLLSGARNKVLIDALSDALGEVDPTILKAEIVEYIPSDIQKILAKAGIRDEHVFPLPSVLKQAPTLVGYYRLLLGVPQKTFYSGTTGMGQVKGMEMKGSLNAKQLAAIPQYCKVMGEALSDLVRLVSPTITSRDVNDLPLLTLGSQFQGGNNNAIGKLMTDDAFQAITDIVSDYIIDRTDTVLVVENPTGQVFVITEASDPDLTIEKRVGTTQNRLVAIEIKGGTDVSNAHNRAGEAEKSHLKAKNDGFKEFWTLSHITGLDLTKLRSESPTTDVWYDVAHVVAQSGTDWDAFQERVRSILDFPVPEPAHHSDQPPPSDTSHAARAPLTEGEAQSITAQE